MLGLNLGLVAVLGIDYRLGLVLEIDSEKNIAHFLQPVANCPLPTPHSGRSQPLLTPAHLLILYSSSFPCDSFILFSCHVFDPQVIESVRGSINFLQDSFLDSDTPAVTMPPSAATPLFPASSPMVDDPAVMHVTGNRISDGYK